MQKNNGLEGQRSTQELAGKEHKKRKEEGGIQAAATCIYNIIMDVHYPPANPDA